MFPVEEPALADGIRTQVLELALRDNQQARLMEADGRYMRVPCPAGAEPVNSQLEILQSRIAAAPAKKPTPREAPAG